MKRPRSGSLRRSALAALLWSGIGQYSAAAIRLLSLFLLGAFLPPEDFGLLGLAMIFLLFAESVGDLGLVGALVQREKVQEPTLSTAFWANLAASAALAAAALAAAGPVTRFLGDGSGAPLLRVLASALPLTALSAVPRALLLRDLRFRRISGQQVVGEAGFALAGVGMAGFGFGVWSLVGAVLAHRLASAAVLWRSIDWRPRMRFDGKALKGLLRFGVPFLGGAIANRAMANIDYFVVSRWLGTQALGYYTFAFQLSALPLEKLVALLRRVAFPAFSRIQNDPQQLKAAYLRGLQHLLALIAPASLLIAALGPPFLEAIYAEKWAPSATVLRLLGIAGLLYSLDAVHAVFFALGKPHIRLWLLLVRLLAFVSAIAALGLSGGIEAVAASILLALAVSGAVNLWAAGRLLGTSLGETARRIWPALRAALLACAPLFLLMAPVVKSWPPLATLALLGPAMTLLYVLGLLPAYAASLKSAWGSLRRAGTEST